MLFNIRVMVHEANNLRNPNMSTEACVQIGKEKRVTKIVQNTNKPFYNEYFVFDLYTSFPALMNTIITLSVREPRCWAVRVRKLIGRISFDVATVWMQPDQRLSSWFTISLPSDVFGKETGLLRCEIQVEADTRFKKLHQFAQPMKSPSVIGGLRARYMLRFYHCVGLEVEDTDKPSEVFITVVFAGNTGMTSKRLLKEVVEWNEQVSFIEMCPPLYQNILIQLCVDKKVLATKHFDMSDISDVSPSRRGYLPTYGPTYVHLYAFEYVYCGSLMMSIDTEYVALFKHNERFHGVTLHPILPFKKNQYGQSEHFMLYGVLFETHLNDTTYDKREMSLSIDFGKFSTTKIGGSPDTLKYKACAGNSNFVYLPINEKKPCIFIYSEWPNTLHRLANSNMIHGIAQTFRKGVNLSQDLISRGSDNEARDTLKSCIVSLKRSCHRTKSLLISGTTPLDKERVKSLAQQLNKISAANISGIDVDIILKETYRLLYTLDKISEDVQDSFPNIIISLKCQGKSVGFYKMHPRIVTHFTTYYKRASDFGKINSLQLKSYDQKVVGKVDIWFWLGFVDNVALCLRMLPPGHEDITKVVLLPQTLTYSTSEIYSVVSYICGGHIDKEYMQGLCNLSVRVICGNHSAQTKIIRDTLAPSWKETLSFTVKLYPSPYHIQSNPPAITVELWDQKTKPASLIASSLVFPKVRLQPISTTTDYNLEWIKIGSKSQILAMFEIIQIGKGHKTGDNLMPQIIPQICHFPTIPYVLEVVFWGVRAVDISGCKQMNKTQAIIQLGSTVLKSNIIARSSISPNFQHHLQKVKIYLTELNIFSPPIVLWVTTSTGFVGSKVETNIKKYKITLPTMKQWGGLTSYRKSVIKRAEDRKTVTSITMPDLIPLMDVKSTRVSTTQDNILSIIQRRVLVLRRQISNTFGKVLNFLKSKIYIQNEAFDYFEEDDEDTGWWFKYYSETIQIYRSELENQSKFNAFEDVFKSFIIKQRKIIRVKIMMCLYRWPKETSVVTLQGQDPENGVLKQTELSESVTVLVRVYCVRAHNLHPSDLNNKADPYIEIATPSKVLSDKANHVKRQLNPIFGKSYDMIANFPVDSVLAVRVKDWDRFTGNDLIGETYVDLENRFYSKYRATCGIASTYSAVGYNMWRDSEKPTTILERLCNAYHLPLPHYYDKSVLVGSKEFIIQHKSIDEEENQESLALLALNRWHEIPVVGHSLVPEHVETRSLFLKETPSIERGKLEMWIDLFDLSLGSAPLPVNISSRKPTRYELRVIIWNTAKIPLVDSSYFVGKKHVDIFVKGWLGDKGSTQSTDVHYTSINGEGLFNWRFIFPFQYIRAEKRMVIYKKQLFEVGETEYKVPPVLHLQVWDSDRVTPDDFIGAMELDLTCMPRGARYRRTCRVPKRLTPLNSLNLFKVKHVRGWWPFICTENRRTSSSYAGFLEAEFNLLSYEEALSSPAGLGRAEPVALLPPLRPEIKFKFWLAPFRIFVHYICVVHKGKLMLSLLTVGLVLFILVGIYSVPMFIIKRILGA